jgi:glycosyltransferase involved in cell wall biosynthesis
VSESAAPGGKRFLFVDHAHRILGGAEINLVELLESAAASSRWTAACACAPGSPLGAALAPLPVRQFDFGLAGGAGEFRLVGRRFSILGAWRAWGGLRRARARLAAIVAEFKPDRIISCTSKDHFCAGAVGRQAGVPSIWWVNDVVSAEFFAWPVRQVFYRQARRLAARLVVVSEFARGALLAAGLPADTVVTIHNGIPLTRYQRCPRGVIRQRLALSSDHPLVGILGRFTPWKGQEFFIQLAASWIREHATGHFALIGQAFNEEKAFEDHLRQLAAQPGLAGRVHFIPFQAGVAAALSDLDVLVHASNKPEPFGRVLIEAMAVGTPVIAARAGGVPEIITDGVDGLLVDPGHLEGYAAALARLLDSPAESSRLAAAARRTVESRFTIERVREQFTQL